MREIGALPLSLGFLFFGLVNIFALYLQNIEKSAIMYGDVVNISKFYIWRLL